MNTSNDERLKAILARAKPTSAVGQKSKEEVAASAAARNMVENAWVPLRNHLNETARTQNPKLPEHLRLSVRNNPAHALNRIESLELTLGDQTSLEVTSFAKCFVEVAGDGTISVQIGTASKPGVKQSRLQALTATPDDMDKIVVDFLDANVPAFV